ncbi:MAG TPA: aldo/keto reductase [Ktedonobacteraceae bacterium]
MIQESQYRPLGASGIKVSPLGTGTNRWVQDKNNEAVFQTFRSFVDAGVNLFDTAEVYNGGKSERLLGECARQDSRSVVIASKFAPLPTRLSHRQFMNALDASLSRLGVQTIDLYYIHWPFLTFLSIETMMDMMARAIEAGKVRAVGVSNFSAGQMCRAADRLARYDIPLAANQVYYNLLHRQPEVNGVLDACRELNVALVAFFPLASGRLTSGSSPAASSRSSSSTREKRQGDLQETLHSIAQKRGKSISQVVLNWFLHRDEHVIPIPGATSARHALENADTLSWELSNDEFAAIDLASFPWKR